MTYEELRKSLSIKLSGLMDVVCADKGTWNKRLLCDSSIFVKYVQEWVASIPDVTHCNIYSLRQGDRDYSPNVVFEVFMKRGSTVVKKYILTILNYYLMHNPGAWGRPLLSAMDFRKIEGMGEMFDKAKNTVVKKIVNECQSIMLEKIKQTAKAKNIILSNARVTVYDRTIDIVFRTPDMKTGLFACGTQECANHCNRICAASFITIFPNITKKEPIGFQIMEAFPGRRYTTATSEDIAIAGQIQSAMFQAYEIACMPELSSIIHEFIIEQKKARATAIKNLALDFEKDFKDPEVLFPNILASMLFQESSTYEINMIGAMTIENTAASSKQNQKTPIATITKGADRISSFLV